MGKTAWTPLLEFAVAGAKNPDVRVMMSYVYMKVLESTPARYDRGMQIVTLGRWKRLQDDLVALIAEEQRGRTKSSPVRGSPASLQEKSGPASSSQRSAEETTEALASSLEVLELGCGTGALALRLAQTGARVTAIDTSVAMLDLARQRAREAGLSEELELRELGAVSLDTAFPDDRFDRIVSSLLFSELSAAEITYTLAQCHRVLRPEGRLLLADEVLPATWWGRLASFLFRLPFALVAFLLTQTTTHRVARLPERLKEAGFALVEERSYLWHTLQLFVARRE